MVMSSRKTRKYTKLALFSRIIISKDEREEERQGMNKVNENNKKSSDARIIFEIAYENGEEFFSNKAYKCAMHFVT